MKQDPLFRIAFRVADLLAVPFVYPAAWLMKAIRRIGFHRLPLSRRVLLHVGVLPIRKHYYEPLFDGRELKRPLHEARRLPGIDWNTDAQLALLSAFGAQNELRDLPTAPVAGERRFHLNNGAFEAGDAEFLYQIIRLKKPARVFEIGSGHSTLMAMQAIAKNAAEDSSYACKHVCVEPFEQPWLERIGVTVIRSKVEEIDPALFSELDRNDLLFIDSSHMIRPQGDVLFEYLELLPSLNAGVIVHVHDVFSPRDYLHEWVVDQAILWNEQYLLEAFLTCNREWSIIGALNFLHRNYYELLQQKCPNLTLERQPGSFYIQRAG